MGLDMYAMSVPKKHVDIDPVNPLAFKVTNEELTRELYYWRKHPNLHGWMHELYLQKGGELDDDFNGTRVPLDIVDIVKLKLAVSANILPSTSGFFFGESTGDETADDIRFCDMAAEEIASGGFVYYDSSW